MLAAFVAPGAIAGLGGAARLGKTPFRLADGFGSSFDVTREARHSSQLNPIASIPGRPALRHPFLRRRWQSVIGGVTAIVDIIRGLIIIFAVAGMAMVKLPKVKAFIASLATRTRKLVTHGLHGRTSLLIKAMAGGAVPSSRLGGPRPAASASAGPVWRARSSFAVSDAGGLWIDTFGVAAASTAAVCSASGRNDAAWR